jgi:hypothetical protein
VNASIYIFLLENITESFTISNVLLIEYNFLFVGVDKIDLAIAQIVDNNYSIVVVIVLSQSACKMTPDESRTASYQDAVQHCL